MIKPISSIAIVLLLVALLPAPIANGGEAAGRAVWWGHNIFWKNSFSYHTNGVIEMDDGLLSDASSVAAGHLQAYARRQDGTVLSLGRDCYEGSNLPPGLSNVVSLTMQGSSTWAIRSDGSVVHWGMDPDRANTISTLKDIRSVAWAGYRSFIALKRDGTLMGVRLDQNGTLNGVRLDRPDPALPVRAGGQLVSNVTQIAANAGTPILLLKDGSVVELIPDRSPVHSSSKMPPFEYSRLAPIRINNENLREIAFIAGSGSHGLAARSNGTVVAWGHNSSGQCEVPADLSNVVAVAAAGQRSLALKRRRHGGCVGRQLPR